MCYKTLPIEIINIILEYHGYHKERNRKYIKQINIHDPKYDILRIIPDTIVLSKGWGTECYFVKQINEIIYRYMITIIIYENYVEWKMETFIVLPKRRYNRYYNEYQKSYHKCITHM